MGLSHYYPIKKLKTNGGWILLLELFKCCWTSQTWVTYFHMQCFFYETLWLMSSYWLSSILWNFCVYARIWIDLKNGLLNCCIKHLFTILYLLNSSILTYLLSETCALECLYMRTLMIINVMRSWEYDICSICKIEGWRKLSLSTS